MFKLDDCGIQLELLLLTEFLIVYRDENIAENII